MLPGRVDLQRAGVVSALQSSGSALLNLHASFPDSILVELQLGRIARCQQSLVLLRSLFLLNGILNLVWQVVKLDLVHQARGARQSLIVISATTISATANADRTSLQSNQIEIRNRRLSSAELFVRDKFISVLIVVHC